MSDLRAFYGPNAGYVLDQYERYLANPESVDPEMRVFFATFNPSVPNGPVARATRVAPTPAEPALNVAAVVGAAGLTQGIREFGHLAVQLDPLGSAPHGAPELVPEFHGTTEAELRALPASAIPSQVSRGAANAAEAVERLRQVYTSGIGYDFDQVQVASERAWLRDAVETGQYTVRPTVEIKRRLLKRLTEVEGFEKFIHQTYLGQKRFSIEGTDTLVPMMDEVVRQAAAGGVREIVIGMAHRGRLNVLTHVLGKPYAAVLAAFEGNRGKRSSTDKDDAISGDVKYHLGGRLIQRENGETVAVPLVLAPNPSHLEFVNPVVEGMVRASQDDRTHAGPPPQDTQGSLALLLHGDAAFPGQGIVAETLNLSGLKGYSTGGTIHIIVNNQIGFTTDVGDSRSTLYAGDLAKGFEIPVVHVNADDPVACLTAAHLAFAFRQRFKKDFLIDLVGYRRWGHNEGDEPSFTQPRMYAIIAKHPTVRQLWGDRLVADGTMEPEAPGKMLDAMLDNLAAIRKGLGETPPQLADEETIAHGFRREVDTAVALPELRALHDDLHRLPEGFKPTSKLLRQWQRRSAVPDSPEGKVDWAHAETLAFASILAGGIPIRLTGQDAERGTFSQRHLVLHDAATGERYVPLQALPEARASFAVYNSPLSEAAAVGFEYGYSVHAPEAMVLWEAQFGDFANSAQVLIDQFMVAARAKWRQDPALVLLLPHGYEGQGPEHSSARLERFLQLSAEDNLRVANCTTAAQYFHLLRRQALLLGVDRHPLVLMTPKSLLRHPLAASTFADLTSGTFEPVLDDPFRADNRSAVTRLVLCSGKIAVDLEASEASGHAAHVAVARVEQLAPFQTTALRAVIDRYPNLDDIVWAQEEPRNMGAWSYMEPRLRDLLAKMERPLPIRYVGRPDRASPAEGSAERHAAEQARIVAEALEGASLRGSNGNGHRTDVLGATANEAKPVSATARASG
ncbi:MAG: 2-oxoglutarate dehydrogenase E1 component [Thermomicrobiales bacterium]|nr:2-oxoglutarate dehydrogenase E1 component [Thermomicrobiales bacterium]